MTEQAGLLEMTADIVAAHVGNNSVGLGDVPTLISNVHSALAGLSSSPPAVDPIQEPAVSVRASIKPESITCLECGAKGKTIKRHLMVAHQLTPAAYKAKWNLKADYPLVAPDYAAKRKALAVKIGLGKKATGRRSLSIKTK